MGGQDTATVARGPRAASAPGACPFLNNSDAPASRSSFCSLLRPFPPGAIQLDPAARRLRRMRSSVLTWARCTQSWTTENPMPRGWRALFVTLTYAAADGWAPEHVSKWLDCLQAWWRRYSRKPGREAYRIRSGLPYLWVMELQERGAPHYHALIWLPRGVYLPRSDSRGWWPHGCTNTEPVRVSAVGYVAKYSSKASDAAATHALPAGARISGRGGLPRSSMEAREARWWNLPKWLRDRFPLSAVTTTAGLVRRYAGFKTVRARIARAGEAVLVWGRASVRDASGAALSWISEFGELLASPWRVVRDPLTGSFFAYEVK